MILNKRKKGHLFFLEFDFFIYFRQYVKNRKATHVLQEPNENVMQHIQFFMLLDCFLPVISCY